MYTNENLIRLNLSTWSDDKAQKLRRSVKCVLKLLVEYVVLYLNVLVPVSNFLDIPNKIIISHIRYAPGRSRSRSLSRSRSPRHHLSSRSRYRSR